MPLSPGDKLGPYEIIAPIGKGGMGEVYKARDARLDRIVAIKVSDAQFSERFEREARAIGQLNHSNICQLYDVGANFLVMEYIDGMPLKGPLPVDQALKYAVQICDALDSAHKKGITHRDLKPANVLVAKAGIKLLDFGLAKLGTSGIAQTPKPPNDATLTMALTGKNEIVGTLYYMSPEQLQAQATGQEIDGRSDIFSFGLVLYEMLTGKRAFEGASPASVIAAIMERPAPSIGNIAPPALDRLLKKCLAKDPDERWQTARDLKDELEWIANASGEVPAPPARSRLSSISWAAGVSLFVIAASFAFLYFRHPVSEPIPRAQFSIPPPQAGQLLYAAISPDGRSLAFVLRANGQVQLWLRPIGSLTAQPLAGTQGAAQPFWSPDSGSIAFIAQGKLKRLDLQGGSPQVVCNVGQNTNGGTWNPGGLIVLGGFNTGLFSVPASGGELKPMTTLDPSRQEVAHSQPQFLPDGRHYFYLSVSSPADNSTIYVGLLGSSETKPIRKANSAIRYVNGSVLFGNSNDGTLFSQPFDAERLELSGDPVRVADQVGVDPILQFSVSDQGAVAFVTGSAGISSELLWMDRTGKSIGQAAPAGEYLNLELSRDAKRVAFERRASGRDIWVLDLARASPARLTFTASDEYAPIWSPDGTKIAYSTNRDGASSLYQKSSSGSGEEELLLKSPSAVLPFSWSSDGGTIVFRNLLTKNEVWYLPLAQPRKPVAFLQSRDFAHMYPQLSPDGHWLVYASDESGRIEIYVQSFPKPSAKWQVSTEGGFYPRWSRDGRELYFLSSGSTGATAVKMMATSVKAGSSFEAGTPRQLFNANVLYGIGLRQGVRPQYDIAPDGRFLINAPAAEDVNASITVVLNWQAKLNK